MINIYVKIGNEMYLLIIVNFYIKVKIKYLYRIVISLYDEFIILILCFC